MIWKLILSRVFTGLVTLLAVSLVIFASAEILPGDVAARALGRFATEEAKAIFRKQLNLDRPAPERYLLWLGAVVHGDFGKSLINQKDVSAVIAPKLWNTLVLSSY